jgi:ribosomal protein L5
MRILVKRILINPQEKTLSIMIRLKEHYLKVIAPDLAVKLNIKNSLELPRVEKIILTSSADFESGQIRGVVQETNAIKKKSKKLTKAQQNTNKGGLQKSSSPWDNIPHQVKIALLLITGQRSTENIYKVTRPGLNVRKNQLASFQTTLRKEPMYFFLDRLITEVLPNVTDFKSLQSMLALKTTSPWLDDGSKLK